MNCTDALARQIVAARRALTTLDCLDDMATPPAALADAYTVQKRATGLWNDDIAGWKVGATTLEIQQPFGISECIYGP
jgi:2-keto-4-pentenoate hydratase